MTETPTEGLNIRAHIHLDGALFHDALSEAVQVIVERETGIKFPIQQIQFWGNTSESIRMMHLKTVSVDIDYDVKKG